MKDITKSVLGSTDVVAIVDPPRGGLREFSLFISPPKIHLFVKQKVINFYVHLFYMYIYYLQYWRPVFCYKYKTTLKR